jgi:hypothetical protein
VNIESEFLASENDNKPVAPGLSFARSGNTLLVDIASIIGIPFSLLKLIRYPAKHCIADPLFFRKAAEPYTFENPHSTTIVYFKNKRKPSAKPGHE